MQRAEKGLCHRTSTVYASSFKLFVAFTVYMGILRPWTELAVITFLEFLAQNSLSAASLQNYVTVLGHYFSTYAWPKAALQARRTVLLIKSVKMNSVMKPKVKGVMSIQMLKILVEKLQVMPNYLTYKAIMLLGFFGFFRLASLVPTTVKKFDSSRFPLVRDVIFTSSGMQIILKCAKNMQAHDAYKIIHVPKLQVPEICPVLTVKRMLKYVKSHQTDPLFLLVIDDQRIPVTAFKVRNVLTVMVKQMKLNPKDYGFHCFRRSGATLALELKVPLENIKIHGHWKSDVI